MLSFAQQSPDFFMKLFNCKKCAQLLYFENTHCENCSSPLGFDLTSQNLLTLTAQPDNTFGVYPQELPQFRYCKNAEYQACNWLVPIDPPEAFCAACQLNHTIPYLGSEANLNLWRKLEVAKHRLVYSLMQLGLPIHSRASHPTTGLAFDFLEDQILPSGKVQRVLTGHANGLVTINISEADDAQRLQNQLSMGERYRTLLGHFRHEVGHYYWDILIKDSPYHDAFRRLFGDEQQDYGEALKRYYAQGAPSDWSLHYISAYASAHPWEDWAETWAHYLHIMDTLATAYSFGLRVAPRSDDDQALTTVIDQDPYHTPDFNQIYALWLPLTVAVNSINRSMGQPDLYPFVIPPPVVKKLKYIHTVCQAATV